MTTMSPTMIKQIKELQKEGNLDVKPFTNLFDHRGISMPKTSYGIKSELKKG